MIQFPENAQIESQKDRRMKESKDEQSLFYRTLPATTGGPNKLWEVMTK